MKYHPINCSLYDKLESFAIKKSIVKILYSGEDGKECNITGNIVDIYSVKKEEYLKINEETIRLDRIIRIADS